MACSQMAALSSWNIKNVSSKIDLLNVQLYIPESFVELPTMNSTIELNCKMSLIK